eukprot:SAG31_NODE_36044_length_317_cov_0.706422_1_plen_92_part_10
MQQRCTLTVFVDRARVSKFCAVWFEIRRHRATSYIQNPAYYELLQEAAFKSAPESNLTQWLINRAHRRYGLKNTPDADVSRAWTDVRNAGYA